MIKKNVISILVFFLGLILISFCDSTLKLIIIDIYQLTLGDKLVFLGKCILLFPSWTSLISFSFLFTLIWFLNNKLKLKAFICLLVITIIIFFISLCSISFINIKLKLIQCTACDDGILKIHYNSISYDSIIILSLIVSLIPNLVFFFKNKISQRNK